MHPVFRRLFLPPCARLCRLSVKKHKNGWFKRTTQQNEEIEGGSKTTASVLT